MKKTVLILIIVIFIAVIVMTTMTLTSCGKAYRESEYINDRFEVIAGVTYDNYILVDKETGVCYMRYGYGVTVLVHADGTPILYVDGEMK